MTVKSSRKGLVLCLCKRPYFCRRLSY